MDRYVIRKEGYAISKKILLAQPLGSRKRERPRLRWREEMAGGTRVFGIRNW